MSYDDTVETNSKLHVSSEMVKCKKLERQKSLRRADYKHYTGKHIDHAHRKLNVDVNDDVRRNWSLTKPTQINDDSILETNMSQFKDKTTVVKCPKQVIYEETEYTKMFQEFFADGISLKKEIVKKIKGVKGVESVGVGFSTERDGYWPVIRVIADEETCKEMEQDKQRKTTLIQEVTAALKDALIQLHRSTLWNEEELKNTIEIVVNYPLQAYELCSAGEVVETTYNFHDNVSNKTDTRRGVIGYKVCHEVTIGDNVQKGYYQITGYHPLIPSHSVHFQQTLNPLPTTNTTLDTPVKYKYIRRGDDTGEVALTTSPPQDPLLVPTLLRATIFPHQAKDGFQLLKNNFGYTVGKMQAVPAPENKAELVVGKSGLVKYMVTNDEDEERSYRYNIVENQTNTIHDKHPCNIDIAILKYTEDVCSIEEQPAQEITWSGPPGQSLDERKGKVVYIKNGTVHRLSDRLTKFNDPPQPGEYPGYVWEPADDVNVPLSHSGAPVLLISRNGTTYHLLGSLITKASASPVNFSLNMVCADIAIHHINQILAEQQPYLEDGIAPEMIGRLKKYKQYLTWHSKQQSLSPLMEEKCIRCELNIVY